MMDWESISTIIFLLILGILVVLDRKNIEFKYGVAIRRIKKGKEWIYAVGDRYKTFFKYFGTIAVVIGIISSLVAFYFIFLQAYIILTNPQASTPGLRPILPSIPSKTFCTYALCVPFWFWIIGVLVVLVSHEMSHALVARSANIRIKSFGLISVVVLPGAFVEPDENQIKKSNSFTKLKIYAAGSFANLLVFAIASLATTAMFSYFYLPNGVQFISTVQNSPAYKLNFTGGIIKQIDSTRLSSVQDFENAMTKIKPGENITIVTTTGNYTLTTANSPTDSSKAFIGISGASTYFSVKNAYGIFAGTIDWIFQLFAWLVFLNFGIGLVNLLPIKPLDGGLIYEEIIKIIFKKPKPQYVKALSIFTFLLIIINLVGPYLPQIIAAL